MKPYIDSTDEVSEILKKEERYSTYKNLDKFSFLKLNSTTLSFSL